MMKTRIDLDRRRCRWPRQKLLVFMPLLVLGFAQSMLLLTSRFLIGVEALAAAKNKRRGRKGSGGGKKKGGFVGFGTPAPTLEDFLGTVKKTRLPKDAATRPCPCGATKNTGTGEGDEPSSAQVEQQTYAECCAPLLEEGSAFGGCTTPLQVLQSRYVAFAYRNIGHVIRTTHEECRDYRDDKLAWAKDLDKEGMFDSFEFVGLEVADETGNDPEQSTESVGVDTNNDDDDDDDDNNEAFLEFKVRLRGRSLEEAPARSRSLSSIEGEETIVSERSRFLRDPESGTWKYAGGDVRSTVQGLEDTSLNA